MEILIIIGAFVVFGLFMYCISAFVWVDTVNKTSPRITFGAFKKVYLISPSKWELCYESVNYRGENEWIHIEFKHYIDVIKYGFFNKKIKNNKDYLTKIQNEKKLIESLQKDIDSYRKENLSEIERLVSVEGK